jgi:uncharacterized membrane protein
MEWANLLLRWAHVIVVIAWIGSSFYFVFLDLSLKKPTAPELLDKGVDGELWAVHGGGFYHPQKYLVAPKTLPKHLHWFFWESYSTWLTGMALFTVSYLFRADTFLIDKNVYQWSASEAIITSLMLLLFFWIVYDSICRLFFKHPKSDLIVGVCIALFVVAMSYLVCHLYSGRAAFLIVGAMMATTMTANVFFWIIPGQRTVVEQLKAGQAPDPVYGKRGKQRSVHNTYFTLPVLIAMLSNHYGWLSNAPQNWVVLCVMMLAGALIRHSFVARHQSLVAGKTPSWRHAWVGCLLILALAVWMAPSKTANTQTVGASKNADTSSVSTPASNATTSIESIIETRCLACHNDKLMQKNVALHTPELIKKNAQAIYQQTVVLKLMPFQNATQITEAERAVIKAWFEKNQ